MDLFEFVKSQVDILDIVKEHTALKQAGIYWKGYCPFHNEKTGSFTVSPHKGIFYCFGCHVNGDSIGFTAKIENCSQIDAAKLLVEKYNLNPPESVTNNKNYSNNSGNLDEQKQYFKTCELVTLWCQKNLTFVSDAYRYLSENRKFKLNTIKNFKLGYFSPGHLGIKSLISFINKHNLLTDDLIKSNILIKNKTSIYSPFEDRIIFPITDYLGRHCGFGGRVFKKYDKRAKYYNSRESKYFSKGSNLFGLDKAKKEIQESKKIFLVEGYTDCIAMFQNNYVNTVAILGTACTNEHIKIISRFATQVYVMYDNDKAGYQAILRLTESCWNFNLELRVITLPEGTDPASYLQTQNSLANSITESQDIYKFIVESSCKALSNQHLSDKIQGINKLTNIIGKVSDPLKRSILLEQAADALGLPINALNDSIKLDSKNSIINNTKNNNNISLDYDDLEKKIFSAIVNNLSLFEPKYYTVFENFSPDLKAIINIIINLKSNLEDNTNLDFDSISKNLSSPQQETLRIIIMEQSANIGQVEFKKLILLFLKKHWQKMILATKNNIINAQNTADIELLTNTVKNFHKLRNNLLEEIK